MCSSDLERHLTVCEGPDADWRPSSYDDRDLIMPADKAPEIKRAVLATPGGKLPMGDYIVRLNGNGKFLVKRLREDDY